MTFRKWIIKKIPAVIMPTIRKESIFNMKPIPPLSNEVPSNRFVIHMGRTLSRNKEANPNVETTIMEDFLFSRNSSE